ncbi:MAG: hemolysin family protein [Acidobacteriota bacterium]
MSGPAVGGLLLVLSMVYFLLALFRAAHLDLSRLKLDAVLREAGRTGGLLRLWTRPRESTQLLLAVHVGGQIVLVLVAVLATALINRALPALPLVVHIGLAFLGTVVVLVLLVRVFLIRVLVAMFPAATVRLSGPVATVVGLLVRPLLLPMEGLIDRIGRKDDGAGQEETGLVQGEELQAFFSMGKEEGILEEEEIDLVRNVVDFGDTIVRDIMTPRTEMILVGRSDTLGAVRDVFIRTKLSRLPVQRESADRIDGMLTIKDLLPEWCKPEGSGIEKFIRKVMFVPETKKVSDLLHEMQREHLPLAIVIDEYGGTAGLVTVEDLVEEIVGEIQDEHEDGMDEILEEEKGCLLVAGSIPLGRVEKKLGVAIGNGDTATIGGFLTTLLGRVPGAGERIERSDVLLEVISADGRRVLKVRVKPLRVPQGIRGRSS